MIISASTAQEPVSAGFVATIDAIDVEAVPRVSAIVQVPAVAAVVM
jgi:hypothetical protein